MIHKIYDTTLRLWCDDCGKKKQWKNKGEYPNNNMTGNVIKAKKDGWFIKNCSCRCPQCKHKFAKLNKEVKK